MATDSASIKPIPTKQLGFTLVELILVLVLLGTLAAIGLPRFFSTDTFTTANDRAALQSALNYVRNRAVTTQCSVEIRLDATGWSAWRDDDGASSCDSSNGFNSPAPACGNQPDYALRDADGSSLSGDLGLSATPTPTLARLIFTPLGQVHLLTENCATTIDASNRAAAGTSLNLAGNRTLSLDGATGYAQVQ